MSLVKIVLDVLKPSEPSIIKLSKEISKVRGVKEVEVTVVEIDRKTETVKMSVMGKNLDVDSIRKVIENFGAVIHSIDQVHIKK